MIRLKLTKPEAKVLEEILTTVQEVYHTLGHGEWAGDGDTSLDKDTKANEAILEILHQLSGDDEANFEAGARVGASEAEITDAIELFEKVEEHGFWNWQTSKISEGVASVLQELAENEGFRWYYDLGDVEGEKDPVKLLIIDGEGDCG